MRIKALHVSPTTDISAPKTSPLLPEKPLITDTYAHVPNAGQADLAQGWASHRLVRIADRALGQASATLMNYHVQNGFFADRMQGMRRLTGLGPKGQLEVQLAPNRNKVPVARQGVDHPKCCALCEPTFKEERGLAWREYNVWPNAFPYMPAEKEHILITTAKHQGQGYSPKVLADMIDYQRFACREKPISMHFNGIAGNSQFHLHWQASLEKLPVQKLLDAGKLSTKKILSSPQGKISTYEEGYFRGILLAGQKDFVIKQATHMVKKLNLDKQTRGAYNMLLLHPKNGKARLVIIPRRADNLKPEVPGYGKVGFGAFSLGGTLVLPREQVPNGFDEHIVAAAQATTVSPKDLPWLDELAKHRGSDLLNVRNT